MKYTLIIITFFTFSSILFSQSNLDISITPLSFQIGKNVKDKGLGYYPTKNNKRIGFGADINYTYQVYKWIGFQAGFSYIYYNHNTIVNAIFPSSETYQNTQIEPHYIFDIDYKLHLFGLNSGVRFTHKRMNFEINALFYPLFIYNNNEVKPKIPTRLITRDNFQNIKSEVFYKAYNNFGPEINDLFYLNFVFIYEVYKHLKIFTKIQYNPFHNRNPFSNISIEGFTMREGYNDPNKIYNLTQVEHNSGLLLLNFGLTYTIFKPKYKYKTKKELAAEIK